MEPSRVTSPRNPQKEIQPRLEPRSGISLGRFLAVGDARRLTLGDSVRLFDIQNACWHTLCGNLDDLAGHRQEDYYYLSIHIFLYALVQ